MVQITCINKAGGNHENRYAAIQKLGWVDVNSGQRGISTRLEIYDFIQNGGVAFVEDAYGNRANVMTAVTALGTKYVKTVADETKADNLLSLVECVG